MSSKDNLPTGFTSVDDAVAIINSDSRTDPVIDLDYAASRVDWISVGGNFRIPRIRRLPADQVYKTKRGKIVEFEHTGDINIAIQTAFERELLRKTILDKFRELAGHEYSKATVKAFSTVADDAQGRDAVRPRVNTPIAKEGSSIGDGETVTTNGQGITV